MFQCGGAQGLQSKFCVAFLCMLISPQLPRIVFNFSLCISFFIFLGINLYTTFCTMVGGVAKENSFAIDSKYTHTHFVVIYFNIQHKRVVANLYIRKWSGEKLHFHVVPYSSRNFKNNFRSTRPHTY